MVTAIQDWFRNSLKLCGFSGKPPHGHRFQSKWCWARWGERPRWRPHFALGVLMPGNLVMERMQALAFKPRASVSSICRLATAWDQTILYQISILLPSRKGKLDLLYFSFASSVFSQADTFSNQISLALQSCLPLSSAFSNLTQSAAKFWHASPNTCEDPLLFCYLVFLLSSLPSKVGKQTNLRRNAETQLRGRPGIPETWEASNCKLHPILNLLSWTPLWKKIQRESLSKLYQISFFSWWWGSWIRGTFFRVFGGNSGHPQLRGSTRPPLEEAHTTWQDKNVEIDQDSDAPAP